MATPLIGIATYVEDVTWGAWTMSVAMVPTWYVDAIKHAGGRPVLIPPDEDASIVDILDGVMLVGGADVGSSCYREEPHPTADVPRTLRDTGELAVYRAARAAGKPVLGVCRGMQVMVVAHGGSLHQHLPDITDDRHRAEIGVYGTHPARFEPDSLIARILGTTETTINSYHHQGIKDPGDLTVTGWAEDGIIESCEDPNADFVLGVQWHPEVPVADELSDRVFSAFIDAARA